MHHFVLPAVWGLVAFASWIGWGRLVGRWLDPDRQFQIGCYAGWGCCLMVGMGGILNATSCCGYTALIVLVGGGFGALLVQTAPQSLTLPRRSNWLGSWHWPRDWPLIVLAASIAFVYGASVCWMRSWSMIDDFSTYSTWPLKMLGAGAAIDPFSMRRLSSFGGYAFLQSIASPFAWPTSGFLLDIGLGSLGLSLTVAMFLKHRGESSLVCAVAGLGMLHLPIMRINTMCTTLAVFVTLVLYLTLRLSDELPKQRRRRVLFVAAMVCAALIAFRPVYLPFTGITFVLAEFIRLAQRKIGWHEFLSDCATMLVATTLILIPWSLSLYFATGSPLWPLVNGNYNRSVNFNNAYLPPGPLIGFIIDVLTQPFSLLWLCSILLLVKSRPPVPIAMLVAATVASIMMAVNFTLASVDDIARYTLPMMAGSAIAAMLSTQLLPAASQWRKIGRFALLLTSALIVTHFFQNWKSIGAYEDSWRDGVLHGERPTADVESYYIAAQNYVAPHKKILTLTAYGCFFNYRRNIIYSLDWAGMASPPPGLPLGAGGEAWLKYLRAQSIDYLICDDFSLLPKMALSSRHYMWLRTQLDPNADVRVPVDQRIMPTVLKTMDDIDDLKKLDPPAFWSGGLFVLDLSRRRPAT